jgi:UDP-N-acetylmuramate dehydrogenase
MAIPFRRDVSFSKLTTLGLGGLCRWLFEPNSEVQAQTFIKACVGEDMPWRVIGGGSNILALGDIEYPVLRLKFDQKLQRRGLEITVPASFSYARLSILAADMGLSGIEYAAGIPGSVGGAICMNAGAYGRELIDVLARYRFLTVDGEILEETPELGEFHYRRSDCANGKVILGLTVKLVEGNPDAIRSLMAGYRDKRSNSQPLNKRSIGCVFKNPTGYNAGKLIDQAGLKGLQVGDAEVSREHGNFLVNNGLASSAHFFELMTIVQRKVEQIHGIKLEPEVEIWGTP